MCMRLWGGNVEGACVCGCGVGMWKEHVQLWNEMWREHVYAAVGWECGGSMCMRLWGGNAEGACAAVE